MKQYKRSARINRLLQEEISDIIRRRLKDPRIGMVSVTRVETTEDLRSSKIHVSFLDDAHAEEALAALSHAAGLIRSAGNMRSGSRNPLGRSWPCTDLGNLKPVAHWSTSHSRTGP